MKLLVDTNILIDHFRQNFDKTTYFYKIANIKDIILTVPAPVIMELYAGKSMAKTEISQKVNNFVESHEIIIPDLKCYKLAGEIIREQNYQIPHMDSLIAAIAIEKNIPVYS